MLKINLVLISFVSIFSSFSLFPSNVLTNAQIKEKDKQYLDKLGLDVLDSEIRIVAAADFFKKQNTNQKDRLFINETIKKYLAMHDEQIKNGYVNEPNPRAKELIELPLTVTYQFNHDTNSHDQAATHLRHSIAELQMGYAFAGVPESAIDNLIAIAPMGAYKQINEGDDADGWDGAVQFFDKKGLGVCAFSEHNMKLAHGGVELIQELMSYDVNEKPTILLIKGNESTGFLYKISWYDNTFARELECANKSYSLNRVKNVISLANVIDLN